MRRINIGFKNVHVLTPRDFRAPPSAINLPSYETTTARAPSGDHNMNSDSKRREEESGPFMSADEKRGWPRATARG